MLDTIDIISTIIILLALVFVIWQFVTMIRSSLTKKEKGLWTILFVVASVLTAIVWIFVKRK